MPDENEADAIRPNIHVEKFSAAALFGAAALLIPFKNLCNALQMLERVNAGEVEPAGVPAYRAHLI
jgi:hypothetical protein